MPAGTITQTGLYTAPAAPPVINYGGGAGQQGVVTISATSLYPKPGTLLGATVGDSETFVITAPSITSASPRPRSPCRSGPR